MRVFTFISKDGDGIPLAQRIAEEGNRTLVFINNPKFKKVGDGFIEKHPAKGRLVSKEGEIDESLLKDILTPTPDCVVFDMVGKGFGKLADSIRKKGISVIGGSEWGDQVELDRPYGGKVMKVNGIQSPKTIKFTDYKEAIKFVQDTGKTYVYKPSGNQGTTTTYVARGVDDMCGMLEYYSTREKVEFELQEKVEGECVEISTEVWFNGKDVLDVNCTMEEKAICCGGIGPLAGSMGSVVFNSTPNTRLFREGIGRLVPQLKKIGYRGPIDLNTIVTKDKLFGLEFTARFGYDAIFTFSELLKHPLGDTLYSVAAGVADPFNMRNEYAMGLTFIIEPYPVDLEKYTDALESVCKDRLLQGITPENMKHLWFFDVYLKDKRWLCAGTSGNLGVITARGSTVKEAQRRCFRTMKNLIIPDVIYREDVRDGVVEEIEMLKKWGWI